MERFSRTQRWLLVLAGVAATIIFLLLAAYFAAAAAGHPRAKHVLLFIVLAAVSALVAWFSLPEGMAQSGGPS